MLPMNIVHFILGFPPQRSGGLTKYAIGLANAEKSLGHNVFIMYPGNFSFFSKKSKLKKITDGIYELTNGLPVPLLYGIRCPLKFHERREIVGLDEFIKEVKPEVFHIHTLMGLPKELLLSLKAIGVKIVYTSHDYYGFYPKVNFIDNNGETCEEADSARCSHCCRKSPCLLFLKIRNSKFIVLFKKIHN